jgi:hypothetical protein
MAMPQGGPDITGLLVDWSKGDESARSPLIDAVYAELRITRGSAARPIEFRSRTATRVSSP